MTEQQHLWEEPQLKRCSACGLSKPLEDFNRRSTSPDGRQWNCRKCNRRWHALNRERHNEMIHARTERVRRERAVLILEYLRCHPCVDCGETDPIVLEFDHLRDKIMDVTSLAKGGHSWRVVMDEIAKCEVVCANCHRRRTAARRRTLRYLAVLASEGDEGGSTEAEE